MDYQIFDEASRTDRIMLWMMKCHELMEVSKLLDKKDVMLLKKMIKEE